MKWLHRPASGEAAAALSILHSPLPIAWHLTNALGSLRMTRRLTANFLPTKWVNVSPLSCENKRI
jgi:hypothetical protein